MNPEHVMRATEIVFSLGSRLVPMIAGAIGGGADEQAATRAALQSLAAMPELDPVMPKVRAMFAAARRAGVAAEDEPTRERLGGGE